MEGQADPGPLDALARVNGHFGRVVAAASPKLRAALAAAARVRAFSRGEVLAPAGVESVEIGYVLDGALGMILTLADGREHIAGLLVPMDMYGRLFDGPPACRIEALSDGRAIVFDRARFEAILRREPELERMFLVSTLDELDAAREWVLLLGGARVAERVAAFLLILARRREEMRQGRPGPLRVRLPARRADLSRCLGIRPESFSRAVHRLADEGALRIINPETFELLDLGRLAEISNQAFAEPEAGRSGRGAPARAERGGPRR